MLLSIPDKVGSCNQTHWGHSGGPPRLLNPSLGLVEETPMVPSACPSGLLAHHSRGQAESWWHHKPRSEQDTYHLCRGPELWVPQGRGGMHQWG